jgi:hypothetical protein
MGGDGSGRLKKKATASLRSLLEGTQVTLRFRVSVNELLKLEEGDSITIDLEGVPLILSRI